MTNANTRGDCPRAARLMPLRVLRATGSRLRGVRPGVSARTFKGRPFAGRPVQT